MKSLLLKIEKAPRDHSQWAKYSMKNNQIQLEAQGTKIRIHFRAMSNPINPKKLCPSLMKVEIEFQHLKILRRRNSQRECQVDGFDSQRIIIFITMCYHLQCKNSENISLCYMMYYYVPGPGVGTVCFPS